MSSVQANSEQVSDTPEAASLDLEPRGRRHPRVGRRSGEDVLRGPGLAARRGRCPHRRDRIVQFTPPGSGCSIQFGTNVASARARLGRRACTWSSPTSRPRVTSWSRAAWRSTEVFHGGGRRSLPRRWPGASGRRRIDELRVVRLVQRSGRQRLAAAGDHDRLPGRVDPAPTSFASASRTGGRAAACRRGARGARERIGQADPDWPDWYAEYMVREQAGEELPT